MSADDTELERALRAMNPAATLYRQPRASIVEGPVTDHTPAIEAAYGAVVTFLGVVRNHDAGRPVVRLDYEAHPDAPAALRECVELTAARHPGVALDAQHATGTLEVGEVALVVHAASPHRAEAFAACSALVDHIKATVPIWKRQHFADGTSEWVAALE